MPDKDLDEADTQPTIVEDCLRPHDAMATLERKVDRIAADLAELIRAVDGVPGHLRYLSSEIDLVKQRMSALDGRRKTKR